MLIIAAVFLTLLISAPMILVILAIREQYTAINELDRVLREMIDILETALTESQKGAKS